MSFMTAEEFKNIRKSLGLTQMQMALCVGLKTRKSVIDWEKGVRKIPSYIIINLKWLTSQKGKDND